MHIDTVRTSPKFSPTATVTSNASAHVSWSPRSRLDRPGWVPTGPLGLRNRLQTVTLLDAINEHNFDAAFGGARRDEDKARAKERILSFS